MGQINSRLRSVERGISHWCDGCKEMHLIPDSWLFNGNYDAPSFQPSVKITSTRFTELGEKQLEQWRIDKTSPPNNKFDSTQHVCHYILTDGIINYCGDCTHDLKGQKIPLPLLPNQ